MSAAQHTITIEPVDLAGVCELAVVDRCDGVICIVCCLQHDVPDGVTLHAVAVAYARAFEAVLVDGVR